MDITQPAVSPAHCGCGQLRRAGWELQLWLERPSTGEDPEKLCLHLWLCGEHKGVAEDHIPAGWTMTGRAYHRNDHAETATR